MILMILCLLAIYYFAKGDISFSKFEWETITIIYIALLFWAIISVILSYIDFGFDRETYNRGAYHQIIEIGLMATGLILIYLVRWLVNTPKLIKLTFYCVVLVGIIGSLQMIYYWVEAGFPLFYSDAWKQVVVNSAIEGTILNVYYWNDFWAFLFPITFILFIRSSQKERPIWFSITVILGVGLLAAAFADTWVLILIATLVMFPWYPAWMKKTGILVGVLVIIPTIYLGNSILLARFNSLVRRLELIDIGLKIWKQHPIFGVGPGNYKLYMLEFVPPNYISQFNQLFLNTFHNFYLQVLVEIGIVGLIITIFLFGVFILRLLKIIKSLQPGFQQNLAIGTFAAIVGLLPALLPGGNFYLLMGIGGLDFFLSNAYIWILIGLALQGEFIYAMSNKLVENKSE